MAYTYIKKDGKIVAHGPWDFKAENYPDCTFESHPTEQADLTAQYKVDEAARQKTVKDAAKIEDDTKKADKASAKQKLKALGLTDDEVKALGL